MVIAFVNISILNNWLFLPRAAKLGLPEFSRTSVSSCIVTHQIYSLPRKKCARCAREVLTSKIREQNKSFLRYKKKEWFKFGTWTRKSYIEKNVIAVPNANLSPYVSMYGIKPEGIIYFFR